MLSKVFIQHGFEFIKSNRYINENNSPSLHDLKKLFDLELEADQNCHFRKRAYLKLEWTRETNNLSLSNNQYYFQSKDANAIDGGKIRQFKEMDKKILNLDIVKSITNKNLDMIREYELLKANDKLVIGMHFIRYIVNENSASFSSPDWLHKDNEPLVFVHLIGLSKYALGGDNLIAGEDKKITNVIRLENELDTLVLNQSVYHAVTPLGSKQGISFRDVILFTVEPDSTQAVNDWRAA